ncbi:cyclin-like protein [Lentinula aff. detonsa]|uniref:Cyclin-like protein n=1 Tax=Lentinula aff. detonsa TaxID=2804958 RepID=A0AA38KRC5_9AGAR|nr:cyclin-like protein [Lentinula aff. detonsa]KAJ3795665.1 cyclin-like protein [Lentinula aff. detonsa]
MATDFWASSHYTRWIVDRATLKQARADDSAYVPEPEYLDFLTIYFANLITKLGKKLQFRQRVVATATVFFRRFYLKNSYCETDPYLVISACCYVAAKAEESPVHIKNVVTESRSVFGQAPYNVKHFPSDNSKLAEMEFYLVDDLECDLVVFHPYRTLLALCKKDSSMSPGGGNSDMPSQEAEAGELGTGIGAEDGPRFWGTGEGKLELSEVALQTAWFIINDTYRSELCLLYPPHLIAITAIYLTLVLHTPTQNSIAHLLPHSSAFNSDIPIASESPQATPQPRRSSRSSDPSSKQTQQDPISFLADLNVSLSAISTIAQEIISMYSLWNRYKEDPTAEETRNSNMGPSMGSGSPASHTSQAGVGQRSGSTPLGNTPGSVGEGGTDDSANQPNNPWPFGQGRVVTAMFLSSMLNSMREARMSDMAHPSSGRPVVVNRMLERTG